MNVQETLVSENFAYLISKDEIIAINVEPNQKTKNDLIVLKALADINKWRGLIITLEKPHHYLTYLLGIQGISQRNLTYIDLAYSKKKRIKFPVDITKHRELIGGFIDDDKISLEVFDLIMVDNISTAKMYMRKENLINFIHYLINEAKKNKITLILPMDISKEMDIFEEIKDMVKRLDFEEVLKMPISRIPSGIKGLDELIEGGFPAPSVILVSGSAGSGKTTFAFQFLMEGAKREEKGLYISTLSERTEWMLRFMSNYEFFDPKYLEDGTIIYEDLGKDLGTLDNMTLIIRINELLGEHVPQRIVIDPINVVNNFVDNYRQFLFELVTLLKNWSAVSILTGEIKEGEKYPEDVGYTADGIISLLMKTEDNVIKRYIQILKMRGTAHSMALHPLDITSNGIEVLKARF